MRDFILVNLFFLGIILIATALVSVFLSLMWLLDTAPADYPTASAIAVCTAIVATYFISKALHELIDRRIVNRRR